MKKQKKNKKGVKKAVKTKKTPVKSAAKTKKVKAENEKKEKKIVYAKEKYIRGSARKARLVIDMVRGKKAQDVLVELDFVHKKAAIPVRKAIQSAIANAENNFEMNGDELVIEEAYVNEAPTYKRGRAGSRGRYKRLLKRNCHIVIGVIEK
jgi:large subunit ribosomal protein L22